jgi:Domain of unknown function (DUF1992)
MRTQDEEVAYHIQQALTSGELAGTSGFGKPLTHDAGWEATPDALRMPFKILKDAGFAPPEIELFHQRAALNASLQACQDDDERKALGRSLSELEQKLALRLEALRVTGNF